MTVRWEGELILLCDGRPPKTDWVPMAPRLVTEAPPGVWSIDFQAQSVPIALSQAAAACRAAGEWSGRFAVISYALQSAHPDEGLARPLISSRDMLEVGADHDLSGVGESVSRTRHLSVDIQAPGLSAESLSRISARGIDVRAGSGWISRSESTSQPFVWQRMASLVRELTEALTDESGMVCDLAMRIEDGNLEERKLFAGCYPTPFDD